ncbi:MAG: alanine racemase [Mogibacterium sp.]|nr:alanine racemase [Mogibacterium sp.]
MNRAWIELDFEALKSNIEHYRSAVPETTRIIAVVKADAYGHGAAVIAGFLQQELGFDLFAVASLDEAVELRSSGIHGDILVLGYTDPEFFGDLVRYQITQAIPDKEYGWALERYGREQGTPVTAHIAVDTGMHRIGLLPEEIEVMAGLYRSPDIRITGIFSHLCVADSCEPEQVDFTLTQCRRYQQVLEELRSYGVADPGLRHILNTYAAVNYPEFAYDAVRAGLMLLGVRSESGDYLREDLALRPVLSLKSHITSVREIRPGETVSYGRVFTATRTTRVASLAIGYADGIPRCLSGKLRAIVNDTLVTNIGRICMDQLMLDVTDAGDVRVGDEAILIGSSGSCEISAGELAEHSGTITNEILSRFGKRLEHA